MKLLSIPIEDLLTSSDLTRSRTSKVFDEHLRASIDETGLSEPLKVAPMPSGQYLVIDGVLRLQAMTSLREQDPGRFEEVPAYVLDYARRFEIRYQTDIYQDLLPSQLASLVEHLHQAENVRKVDIARYIGVSPATLRNYTGLWRLLQRGGLFASIVELMDVGVLPASTPYAWLRLTPHGLRQVLETEFSDGEAAEAWVDSRIAQARRGVVAPYQLKYVEAVTSSLAEEFYREGTEVRALKQQLGLRKGATQRKASPTVVDPSEAIGHLRVISVQTKEPVLQMAAKSLADYLV